MTTTKAIITKAYNESTALTFREDGWFNMTKAAKAFDRRIDKFWEAQETKDYMAALLNTLKTGDLVETKRGNQGGTWAHPKLAVFFARWLDTKFAVWCDAVIDDILRGKAELVVTKPETSEIMQMPATLLEAGERWLSELRRAETLKLENTELKAENALLEHEATHLTITEFRTNIRWFFPASVRTKLSQTTKKLTEAAGETVGVKYHTRTDPVRGDHQVKVFVYPVKYLHEALRMRCPEKAYLLDNL